MNDENRELRKAGLKVTVPRLKILQLLEESGERHMSAEDVYRKMLETGDDVSIATVYRVLTQFESAGLITRHNFDNGPAVYEIDRGEHHDHMVNVDTGKVIEFHSDEIEALQKQIAEKQGYELVGHNLVLYVRPKK
ncbi:MAG: ferric iron uptake transcriptional regulator [Gammaproteobacteria bacterium]|nr:MAG: ferric iron uptake transcriptional regulator [Gammaproteobacteria bacterium]